MSSTASESVVEAGGITPPVPGVILVFSGRAPQFRPIPIPRAGVLVLGREDMGGLPVPDGRMSTQHAEVTFSGGQFTVKDLQSRNGTYVDGTKIEGALKVKPGAVVRLAQTIVLLEADLRPWLTGVVKHEDHVIGPTLQKVLDKAVVARSNEAHLLVLGENGSGKELIASRFHEAGSPRGPFVTVNCATIPPQFAEGHLFGALKGAWTGLTQDIEGYIGSADGGVLFLDEIAELNIEVQAKLLRVFETGEYQRMLERQPRRAKLHIVAASHQDLRAAVGAKKFREDLYFRLSQRELRLPPLRERREELPWLMSHALKGSPLELHAMTVEAALLRPWPGNIRELISETRKAAATAAEENAEVVRAEHLSEVAGRPIARSPEAAPEANPHFEPAAPKRPRAPNASPDDPNRNPDAVRSALVSNDWNITLATEALGFKSRETLKRLMRRYGIRKPGAPDDHDDDANNESDDSDE